MGRGMPKLIDLTGKKFGRLTVLSRNPCLFKDVRWDCQCDCGNVKTVRGDKLRSGNTLSCGCLKKERVSETHTKHGATTQRGHMPTYRSWLGMHQRCRDPKKAKYYRDKGITVCEEWDDYTVFLRDMGERPDGFTLDRKDGNKGYSPENCRWATPKQQVRNRSNTVMIEREDGASISLGEIVEEHGLYYSTARRRLTQQGWSLAATIEGEIDG